MFFPVVIIEPTVIPLLEAKQKIANNKNINYAEVYYFNVISLMTVGYDNFAFESISGQLFASFCLLIGPLLVI